MREPWCAAPPIGTWPATPNLRGSSSPGARRYPDHTDFFLDENKILTYTKDPAVGWSFDRPMYLIMNVACGGPDEPAPEDSKLPQFMTVDYVRVYQKTP